MKVNLGIWDTLTKLVVLLLFVAGVLGVVVWYMPLIQQNQRMRKEILRKEQQIRQEEETARQLKSAIDALKHDPVAVERVAREKLGLARPDETIIRFTNNPAGR